MNAVRHGLNSKILLLPGEDAVEYADFTARWFSSLGPETFAEAQLVALIADVAWRLERLRRVEHGHQLAVLERTIEKTDEFIQLGLAERALKAIAALVQILGELTVPPDELADIAGLVMAMGSVFGIVVEVQGLPVAVVDRLEKAIDKVSGAKDGKVQGSTLVEVIKAAEAAKIALESCIPNKKEIVTMLKEKIAAETLLMDDAEMKKLVRYQQLLENTLTRHLEHLKAIKESIKAVGTMDHEQLRELQVRLRVVR